MPTTRVASFTVEYTDKVEFHSLKKEVFIQQNYFFESGRPNPNIIDVGAHFGLTTLYFKQLYPAAQIVAYEPLPLAFELLNTNIFANNLENVQTIQAAWAAEPVTTLTLHTDPNQEWLSTTSIHPRAWTGDQNFTPIVVPAIFAPEAITTPVDLLKLDVEGYEQALLFSLREKLPLIKQIIFEFHPHPTQSLTKLVTFLTDHGYEVSFTKHGRSVSQRKAQGMIIVNALLAH